jgi:hypothetical protein
VLLDELIQQRGFGPVASIARRIDERPLRRTRHRVGIGSLTVAALLAELGRRVAVFEPHYTAG